MLRLGTLVGYPSLPSWFSRRKPDTEITDPRAETPIAPRGPVEYDLLRMHDEDFEAMCHRLVRLEFPAAEKPAKSGDGGADILLPKSGGGFERAWQSKHYPKQIRWAECQKSFDDAVRNYNPESYVFCFPRDLSGKEIRTFNSRFRNGQVRVSVSYWGKSEILARLTESPEGRAIAKHFFGDDGDAIADIKRTVDAGGKLESANDALARLKPVAEYFNASDPYFSYAGSSFPDGIETSPPEGTILSLSESSAKTTQRIDVVPNDEEAIELYGPKGKVSFPDEIAMEAHEALSRGLPFYAEKAELTFDQLPPALGDHIGRPMEGSVSFSPLNPPPPAPWDAQLTVTRGEERVEVEVDLKPVAPPDGFDGALEGTWAGMTVRVLTLWEGTEGRAQFSYSYSLSDGSAREQLKALQFVDLASKPDGTLEIVDRHNSKRTASLETGAADDQQPLEALEAFLGWIVEIEDWSNTKLPVKADSFTTENFESVGQVSASVRKGGLDVVIHEFEFEESTEGDLDSLDQGGPIVMRRSVGARLLGVEIPLGRSQLVVEHYDVFEVLGRSERRNVLVRPKPGHETAFERIAKPNQKPPPPPRKRTSKKARKRSRRKGGRS